MLFVTVNVASGEPALQVQDGLLLLNDMDFWMTPVTLMLPWAPEVQRSAPLMWVVDELIATLCTDVLFEFVGLVLPSTGIKLHAGHSQAVDPILLPKASHAKAYTCGQVTVVPVVHVVEAKLPPVAGTVFVVCR